MEMQTTPSAPGSSATDAPPPLTEHEAWDIATAWQPQLQGKVRLVTDRDGPIHSIVESYAWVYIDTPRPLVKNQPKPSAHLEVVSILRAVVLTWSALAACPGYSGAENSGFWKRVISGLQPQPTRRSLPVHRIFSYFLERSVTDSHGFFDLPGLIFPRFIIEVPDRFNDVYIPLFSRGGPNLAPDVQSKMKTLLAQLEAYRQHTHPYPVIEICLETHSYFGGGQNRWFEAIVQSANAEGGDVEVPPFRVTHIAFSSTVQFGFPDKIQGFLDLVRALEVSIRHIDFMPVLNSLSPTDRARWLQAFLRLDGCGVKAKLSSFRFPRHYVSDAVFQAIMSALPFATSIHSLTFSTESHERNGTFEQTDLPWVAYAIFHPHADLSSWRHLTIETVILTEHSARVLTAMSRGNNLLALLNGTPPESDAYYSARLLGGTVVQCHSTPASDVLFITPLTGVVVDVCGISSLDRATWGEWVAVIIPAYGLGWVRQHEVVDARTHAPSRQSLSSLYLRRNYNPASGPTDDPPELLLHFVPPLGFLLKYLDISTYRDISTTTLEILLRACPSLKTLVVSHAGGLWGNPLSGITPFEAQLEELELSVDSENPRVEMPTIDHIQTSLRNLRALRLRVGDRHGERLVASQATLQRYLQHAPTLRYFHWRNPWADFMSREPAPYDRSLCWTPQALSKLQLTDGKYLYAHDPLHPACAAAFLSAVAFARASGKSALGRAVDRSVLTAILGFAATPVKGRICIEPYDARQIDLAPSAVGGERE